MKPVYPNLETEYAALRAQAAALWALTHRAEYDVMLSEVFPSTMPRIPGEWSRRMAVLESTCARLGGCPDWPTWIASLGLGSPQEQEAA